jgi:hypothetical protein
MVGDSISFHGTTIGHHVWSDGPAARHNGSMPHAARGCLYSPNEGAENCVASVSTSYVASLHILTEPSGGNIRLLWTAMPTAIDGCEGHGVHNLSALELHLDDRATLPGCDQLSAGAA